MALHHARIGRLDAHRHHQRAGLLQLGQHFVRGVAGADGAVPLHAERLLDQQFAEVHDALLLGGEQVVVHVDVIHAELVPQVLHVVVGVLRRVGLVQPLEHRAVAERAGVGAAARGDHRRAVVLLVGEQRQVVGVRKAGQLLVGGEGQFVEIEDAVAARVDDDAAVGVTPDQVADAGQRLAVGEVEHRPFALADDQVVDFGEMLEDRRAERRDVHVAEGDPDFRPLLLDGQRHVDRIHEARGRRREADHLRVGRQHDLGILGDSGRRVGPEAVVQLHAVAEFLQPRGELHDADRRHAVGQHREIRLAGNEVEAGGMNERDAHGSLSTNEVTESYRKSARVSQANLTIRTPTTTRKTRRTKALPCLSASQVPAVEPLRLASAITAASSGRT